MLCHSPFRCVWLLDYWITHMNMLLDNIDWKGRISFPHFLKYHTHTLHQKENIKYWGAHLIHGEAGSGARFILEKLGSDAWCMCDKVENTATSHTLSFILLTSSTFCSTEWVSEHIYFLARHFVCYFAHAYVFQVMTEL